MLKSTYGWFNTELDIAPTFNRAASYTTTYRWHDLNRNNVYDPGEVNLDLNGPDFLSTTSGANAILNPDLKLPHVQELTTSLEREVRSGTAVRALYMLRRLGNDSASVNVLRPFSAFDIASDSRVLAGTSLERRQRLIFGAPPTKLHTRLSKLPYSRCASITARALPIVLSIFSG